MRLPFLASSGLTQFDEIALARALLKEGFCRMRDQAISIDYMDYNGYVLSDPVMRIRDPRLLNMSTYVALVVMGVIGLSGLAGSAATLAGVGLCIAFGLVFALGFGRAATRGQMYVYFAAQVAIVALLLALRSSTADSFNFLLYLLAVQATLVFTARDALTWVVILAAVSVVSAWLALGSRSLFPILFYLVAFSIVAFIGYSLRQAEMARRRSDQLLEELRAAQSQLQDLAVSEERNRLARELHDSVKQQIFATAMQLGAARASLEVDTPAARRHLIEAERLVQAAQQELNTLIHQLRPVGLGEHGIASALRSYVRDWSRQSNIPADAQVQGERLLPSQVEQALFRVAQEALSNVARHSGATHVLVRLDYGPARVSLTIADNGRGLAAGLRSNGIGLHSMRERMASLGGHLELNSDAPTGARVKAVCDYERAKG
jgi:signal transduction histidine kinase